VLTYIVPSFAKEMPSMSSMTVSVPANLRLVIVVGIPVSTAMVTSVPPLPPAFIVA
jgi:hypothetical protein